jgi:D-alanyl-lipoteichoic acid acyltransferase DltB (MBOAT superfamily)
MLFHTWVFLVFFLVFYPVYLLLRKNNQAMNVWIMLASYTFYGWWRPAYLFLLFGTSAIDYFMVLLMDRKRSTRTLWLVISLVSNFGFLGYFKYSVFITENINALLAHFHTGFQLPQPEFYPNTMIGLFGAGDHFFDKVVLPIGISFHTFQSMSYTIDAYRGTVPTERNFIRFLSFVSFFPQLVAGPIERAGNLLTQLQGTPRITGQKISDGLSLFLVGYFKKVALADYLAKYVDLVYGTPEQFRSPALVLATVAFGWQIYFDFSGYTDMARGLAQLMGFRLMLNFNNPYTATGLGDFWNRWHISLSTWFKDYVYFPLGGSRHGEVRTYFNIFLTMVISGIWHGAAWTFIIWGVLHAVARCLTRDLEQTDLYCRLPRLLKQTAVFAFVTFTWIFFRAKTVGDAWFIVRRIFPFDWADLFPILTAFLIPRVKTVSDAWLIVRRIFTTGWADPRFPAMMACLILAVWIYQLLYNSRSALRRYLETSPVRVGLAAAMLSYLLIVAVSSTEQFIYFQF